MDIITISVSISISSNSSSGGSSSSSSGNSNSSSSELPVSLVFGAHMALLLAKFRLCFRVQWFSCYSIRISAEKIKHGDSRVGSF